MQYFYIRINNFQLNLKRKNNLMLELNYIYLILAKGYKAIVFLYRFKNEMKLLDVYFGINCIASK